jgi:hypothetical protein
VAVNVTGWPLTAVVGEATQEAVNAADWDKVTEQLAVAVAAVSVLDVMPDVTLTVSVFVPAVSPMVEALKVATFPGLPGQSPDQE